MENALDTYIPILVLLVLGAGFLISTLLVASILGPKKHTEIKDEPFECGTVGTGDARERFGVKYYLVAMIFILFDVEIVFMYPWAVTVLEIGWPAFFAMLSFLFVLTFGLAYIWKRGVLDWA